MAWAALLPAAAAQSSPAAPAKATYVPATMVNHVAIDIAASPDAVWRTIIDLYVSPKPSAQVAITPLAEPGYPLGGYRMRSGKDGAIDERVVQITERDEKARRLSLTADYLSMPGGLQVYATYQAQEWVGGTRFTIDCHSLVGLEAPADGPAAIAATLAADKAQADAYLLYFLDRAKARLEASAR
jgi:hypothetical protein